VLNEVFELFEDILRKQKDHPEKKTVYSAYNLRITNFLKKWISEFFEDFAKDSDMVDAYEEFIEEKMAPNSATIAKALNVALQRRMERVSGYFPWDFFITYSYDSDVLPHDCKTFQR
tara:strand:- start:1366 stop:1716 length:351 start_codon:yes stop_codon:yes gene_type:complete